MWEFFCSMSNSNLEIIIPISPTTWFLQFNVVPELKGKVHCSFKMSESCRIQNFATGIRQTRANTFFFSLKLSYSVSYSLRSLWHHFHAIMQQSPTLHYILTFAFNKVLQAKKNLHNESHIHSLRKLQSFSCTPLPAIIILIAARLFCDSRLRAFVDWNLCIITARSRFPRVVWQAQLQIKGVRLAGSGAWRVFPPGKEDTSCFWCQKCFGTLESASSDEARMTIALRSTPPSSNG